MDRFSLINNELYKWHSGRTVINYITGVGIIVTIIIKFHRWYANWTAGFKWYHYIEYNHFGYRRSKLVQWLDFGYNWRQQTHRKTNSTRSTRIMWTMQLSSCFVIDKLICPKFYFPKNVVYHFSLHRDQLVASQINKSVLLVVMKRKLINIHGWLC